MLELNSVSKFRSGSMSKKLSTTEYQRLAIRLRIAGPAQDLSWGPQHARDFCGWWGGGLGERSESADVHRDSDEPACQVLEYGAASHSSSSSRLQATFWLFRTSKNMHSPKPYDFKMR